MTVSEVKKEKSPGIFTRIKRFFADMRGEMKKVVWPSKKQVLNNTAIVIGFVLVAAFFIGGFDLILSAVVNLFFKGTVA